MTNIERIVERAICPSAEHSSAAFPGGRCEISHLL